ncbi:hypothetical protein ACFXPQ_26890 [Streptomyces lydicus]|uniref:hypothetical protein n=1 Tax=Streptomyces lydicus TaxID=47763 RepID=UPI0036B479DF
METNAALLELCPEPLDLGVPDHWQHPGRTRPTPLAAAPAPAPASAPGRPDIRPTPVPLFVVPVGSTPPHGPGTALSPDSCPDLNGHSRATLDAASRGRLLARLPDRVSAAMAAAGHWELYGTRGLLIVACGEEARQMGFSVESVRPGASLPHTPYEVLTEQEARTAAGRPAAERERLVTRYWVRKDAALQAVGGGLSLAPERIEAGFPGDRGTVLVPGPQGLEAPVLVRNFTFSASYEFAVATPEPLALTPSFAYSVR